MSADRPPPPAGPAGGRGSDAGGEGADAEARAAPHRRALCWNREAEARWAAGDHRGALEAAEQAAAVVGQARRSLLPWARDRGPDLLDAGCQAQRLATELWFEAGDSPRAGKSAERGLEWARRWIADAGGSPPARLALSTALNDVVRIRAVLGETPTELAEEAIVAAAAAVRDDPSSVAAQHRRADAHLNAGNLALKAALPVDAERHLVDAGGVWASIEAAPAPPATADPVVGLTGLGVGQLRADLAAARGDSRGARALEDRLAIQGADLLSLFPDHAGVREQVRILHLSIADACRAGGDPAGEVAALRAVARIGYRTECPDDRHAECRDWLRRVDFSERQGEFAEPSAAEGLLKSALDLDREERSPRSGGLVPDAYRALAASHLGWGRAELAGEAAGKGIARLEAGAERDAPATRAALLTLWGDAAGALGSPGGALESYHEAFTVLDEAPAFTEQTVVARMGLYRKMGAAEVMMGSGTGSHLAAAARAAKRRADRDDAEGLRELALCQEVYAEREVRHGISLSARTFGEALAHIEGLPNSTRKERDRARLMVRLGAVESGDGGPVAWVTAERRLRRALSLADALEGTPGRRAVAAALDALGHMNLTRGSLGEGLNLFEKALRVRREMLETFGKDPQTLRELARSHRNVGDAHLLLADRATDQFRDAPGKVDASHRARRECAAAHRAFGHAQRLLAWQRKGLERSRLDTSAVIQESALLRERQGDVWLRRVKLGSIQLHEQGGVYGRPVTVPARQALWCYEKAARLLAKFADDRARISILDKQLDVCSMTYQATREAGMRPESRHHLDRSVALAGAADRLRFEMREAARPVPPTTPPLTLRRAPDQDPVA